MQLKKQLIDFKDSFKLKPNFLKIMLFDLLFYVITIASLFFFGFVISKYSEKIPAGMLNADIFSRSPEELSLLASNMQGFYIAIIVSVIASIIITLAAWSLSRGLIYTNLLKKKLTPRYFFKLLGLNTLLAIIILILLVFLSVIVKIIPAAGYVLLALILIAIYFITLIYIYFTKSDKLFKSIGTALSKGTKAIPKLIFPCFLIIVVYILINIISSLIKKALQANTATYIISLLIFIVFLAWARIYFTEEVSKV